MSYFINGIYITVFYLNITVNLKRSSKTRKRLKEPLKQYLSEIIYENDRILNYFKHKVETDFNSRDSKDKMSKMCLVFLLQICYHDIKVLKAIIFFYLFQRLSTAVNTQCKIEY